ncbi:Endonuclease-reverse transcriptase [Popillia japonica]|uniref:Endonuclease-reverse transcriptase n=1 Tax=Popillia japonica TaxID=7064 RepID=A0AAW1IZT0_POPJA
MDGSGIRDLALGAIYLPYDQEGPPPTPEFSNPKPRKGPPPTPEVRALAAYAGEGKRDLLLGCDANALQGRGSKDTNRRGELLTNFLVENSLVTLNRGSKDTNRRGELLTNFLVENSLVTLNRGNKPTFVTANRAEVVDITVSTPRLASWVKQWRVSDEPSLTDHRYVTFNIEVPQGENWLIGGPKKWHSYVRNAYGADEFIPEALEELNRRKKQIYGNPIKKVILG